MKQIEHEMVGSALTCIAALSTSKREDSISARDLAISATTVPKYDLHQSYRIVLYSFESFLTMLIQKLAKGFAGWVCDTLDHEIKSHLSGPDRSHAMVDTARSTKKISSYAHG